MGTNKISYKDRTDTRKAYRLVTLSTQDLHVAFKIERKNGKQKIWSYCLLYKYTYTIVCYLVFLVSRIKFELRSSYSVFLLRSTILSLFTCSYMTPPDRHTRN